jgi:hypothetical protein
MRRSSRICVLEFWPDSWQRIIVHDSNGGASWRRNWAIAPLPKVAQVVLYVYSPSIDLLFLVRYQTQNREKHVSALSRLYFLPQRIDNSSGSRVFFR